MIDGWVIVVAMILLNHVTRSGIPSLMVGVTLGVLIVFIPKLVKPFRWSMVFQAVIMCAVVFPHILAFAPGGGEHEQKWLDKVIAHLESRECDDPKMQEIIDYTIRRYNYIGPFGVRVVQLPEVAAGINNPLCRGVSLDESLLDYHISVGAKVLVHEAMHDYWPHMGHLHIDDDRIWETVK